MRYLNPFEFRLREVLEAFEEAVDFSSLSYSSLSLKKFGFDDEAAIQRAMTRAIQVCRSLDIDPRKHFGYYYKADLTSKQVSREWRVSKLAFYLLICNGEPNNPYTSAFQMQMLRKLLPHLN